MKTESQAFEEWYNANHREPIRPADYRTNGGYRLGIQGNWDVWQASRASLKKELLSDEIVEKCAKALAIEAYHTFGLETLHNSSDKDHAEKEWAHYISPAKAALQAMVEEL